MRIVLDQQNPIIRDSHLQTSILFPEHSKKLDKEECLALRQLFDKLFKKRHLGKSNSSRLSFLVRKLDHPCIKIVPTDKPFEFLIYSDNLIPGERGIFFAIKEGYLSEIKRLIEQEKVDVNCRDEQGNSPLILSIIHEKINQLDVFNYLIGIPNIDLDLTDGRGCSAAYHAVALKDKTILRKLAEKKANLNLRNEDGLNALHQAVEYNDEEAMDILLSNQVKVNSLSCDGTPLWHAVQKGSTQMIQKLLQHKADPNIITDPLSKTPWQLASLCGNQEASALIKSAEGKEYPDPAECTELHLKTMGNLTELNKYLAENPNRVDKYGRTVAHYWAHSGDIQLGHFLFSLQNVGFDIKDSFGRTPLHYAIIEGHEDIVKALIAKRVDLNAKDHRGRFPLFLTTFYRNRVGIANQLIKYGGASGVIKSYTRLSN